jgi:hypothetical protein
VNKCSTAYCKRKTKRKICSTCTTRLWRAKNPERSSYLNLRNNSKRRGIKFELTYEQFLEFGYKHKYFIGKGKTKDSYSIDRIKNELGYTIDNIQILTISQNASKNKRLIYDYENNYAIVTNYVKLPIVKGPF